METLLIRPSDIAKFTPLGGNVDVEKYKMCISDVQITILEPLLGNTLYEKIKTDLENNVLEGLYLELYETYLKPILRHQVFAEYVEVGAYTVSNAGIFKHQPANSVAVEKSEVQYLAQVHRSKSQLYIDRAKKWLCLNNIPEYNEYHSDKVNQSNVTTLGGWKL